MSKLYVVGIGPGNRQGMTEEAYTAISHADIIVGYTKYVEFVAPIFPDKAMLSTPMMKEMERCEKALELAANGSRVAVVCSGDAGVYGMAGLILELSARYPAVKIEVVAGVSAALAGAALLGAPLTHDFAVISLSDLLTPWELIEKRLRAAAQADFCIALYNPSSNKRGDYLKKACEVLITNGKAENTVCGIAENIGRDGEKTQILSLAELKDAKADMFTTVFIGNSSTRREGDYMVTPRGYRNV